MGIALVPFLAMEHGQLHVISGRHFRYFGQCGLQMFVELIC